MKAVVLILAMLAINCFTMAQRRPAPTKSKKVLADFRLDQRRTTPGITKATEKVVLSKVFRKYLTDQDKCNRDFESSGEDVLKSAREAGQFSPSIVDRIDGSFTAAGKTETVYVISVSECNASHADNFGSKRIAIFAGDQLVADVDSDFKSAIIRKTDLDSNGIDELFMTSSDMSQGTLTEMAALFDLRNGRLQIIEDLGTVSEDSCNSELPGSRSRASIVSILPAGPGVMPKLHLDNYESGCRRGSRWRFVSSGKME